MKIKYNDELKKNQDGIIFEEIGKISQEKKNDLDEKVKVVQDFILGLDTLLKTKPLPSSLDSKLVDYINYEKFYNKNK